MVIIFLGKGGPMKMSDIADNLRMSMSNLTAIVDRLVEKGMVRRDRSESDRRVVLVDLLPEGKKISMVHQKCHMELTKRILEVLSETERRSLLHLTKKVADAFTMMKNRVAEDKEQPLIGTE
jgi:DNA-binding MarR family transcriptional regulator